MTLRARADERPFHPKESSAGAVTGRLIVLADALLQANRLGLATCRQAIDSVSDSGEKAAENLARAQSVWIAALDSPAPAAAGRGDGASGATGSVRMLGRTPYRWASSSPHRFPTETLHGLPCA